MHYGNGGDEMSHDLWICDSDIVLGELFKNRKKYNSIRTISLFIPQGGL